MHPTERKVITPVSMSYIPSPSNEGSILNIKEPVSRINRYDTKEACAWIRHTLLFILPQADFSDTNTISTPVKGRIQGHPHIAVL